MNEAREAWSKRLEKLTAERVESAMADVRARLSDHLKRMSDRLGVDVVAGEVKPRVFNYTLLDTAHELCELAESLNIINDPLIEEARIALKRTLNGVDLKDLRKDMGTRNSVKADVDDILSKFNF
jgi:hypothetical protein